MMEHSLQHSLRHHLKLVHDLRWLAVAGQLITIGIVHNVLHVTLPVIPMLAVIALLAIVNLITWRRLYRDVSISSVGLFCQLGIDVIVLTLQLYFSGGITNPFIVMYLLQVIIASMVLTPRQAWGMLGLAVLCGVVLFMQYVPLQYRSAYTQDFLTLHLHGMFVGVMLCGIIIAWFITKLSDNIRAQEQIITHYEEEERADQMMINVSVALTSAIHHLSLPLSEAENSLVQIKKDKLSDDDAAVLALTKNLVCCRQALDLLQAFSNNIEEEGAKTCSVGEYFSELLADWRKTVDTDTVLVKVDLSYDPDIVTTHILDRAILGVLNNAAEAAEEEVDVLVESTPEELLVTIRDDGKGFDEEQLAKLPEPLDSTKKDGIGVGLFLAYFVASRFHGELRLSNRTSGNGALVVIRLPWDKLELE
jgi:two-component system sensor histidine kinase RegB